MKACQNLSLYYWSYGQIDDGIEAVKLLLSRGVNVNAKSVKGYTALDAATSYSAPLPLIRVLLEGGANSINSVLWRACTFWYGSEDKSFPEIPQTASALIKWGQKQIKLMLKALHCSTQPLRAWIMG